jgi:hypothetical protein
MRINVARSLQVPLALATLAIASTVGRASDLLVPGQYGTIQAALDAAIDGDRVVIAAGT